MDCSSIQFCGDKSKVDLYKLKELYNITAFWAQERNIEDLKTAIANSNPVVTVWHDDRLIGCARSTSDGVYRATIWDVVIHPDYQGVGLGRKLVETVISHPVLNRVERVYLMTTHQQKFYQRIGFEENQTKTMVLYNSYPSSVDVITESQPREKQKEVSIVVG
jgi:N-acetylglutamate synthase-like GNAT family acetyltransferase